MSKTTEALERELKELAKLVAQLQKEKETASSETKTKATKAIEDVKPKALPSSLAGFIDVSEDDVVSDATAKMKRFYQGVENLKRLDPADSIKHQEKAKKAIINIRLSKPAIEQIHNLTDLQHIQKFETIKMTIAGVIEDYGFAPPFIIVFLKDDGKRDTTKEPFYLLSGKSFHNITLKQVLDSTKWYLKHSHDSAVACRVSHEMLINICSPELASLLFEKLKFHAAKELSELSLDQVGPVTYWYLHRLLTECGPNAQITVNAKLMALGLTDFEGESVDSLTNAFDAGVSYIEGSGSQVPNKATLYYNALLKSSVQPFVDAMKIQNEIHSSNKQKEDGASTAMTYQELKQLARSKAQELAKDWNLTSRTGAAFQASTPGETQFRLGNNQGRGGGNGNRSNANNHPAPAEGGSERQTFAGTEKLYCRRCRRWLPVSSNKAHVTADHRSNPNNGGGNSSNNGDGSGGSSRGRSQSRERNNSGNGNGGGGGNNNGNSNGGRGNGGRRRRNRNNGGRGGQGGNTQSAQQPTQSTTTSSGYLSSFSMNLFPEM
ncbi:hypothetical protein MPSEU_000951700 [Mayamaea pseudoterrestris]|nr:hypothetical protein MPSEU_000951700 [Mayamaea pseudoterrestris]